MRELGVKCMCCSGGCYCSAVWCFHCHFSPLCHLHFHTRATFNLEAARSTSSCLLMEWGWGWGGAGKECRTKVVEKRRRTRDHRTRFLGVVVGKYTSALKNCVQLLHSLALMWSSVARTEVWSLFWWSQQVSDLLITLCLLNTFSLLHNTKTCLFLVFS